ADEVYNPDMPAIRSEQRLDEERGAGEAGGGVPGALSNQPPVEGQAPEVATAAAPGAAAGAGGAAAASAQPAARSGNVRTQSTRNYELDRTLSYTRHQVGKLRRVSVAVVLDDKLAVDAASGERRSAAWDAAALERITLLVRDAVGYDSRRGDSVNVVNTAFFDMPEDLEEIPAPPLWEQPWFWPAVRTTLGALGVLVLLLGIVRPVMRSLTSNARQMRALEERHRMERMVAEQSSRPREEDVAMLPPPKAEYERRMSAVQGLVESDAEKVAQVVRKWVRENE
ncbi:MAG: flagellar M-ring protein FliF C-terminal domain-containing protein, partial [Gammaproteobacteria bacterium]